MYTGNMLEYYMYYMLLISWHSVNKGGKPFASLNTL